MKRKQNVLFLCTHNSARSQMAEAFLKRYGGERFNAHSAGLEPTEIDPMTREVMREIDMEMEGQQAKGVQTYLGRLMVHHLIIVCEQANRNCPHTWPGLEVEERLFWPIDDPAAAKGGREDRLQEFRRARDQIERQIQTWLKEVSEKEV